FESMANVAFFATDRALMRGHTADPFPAVKAFEPRATVRVARIRHQGNCDPEPLAWKRLAILMANRHRVKLDVSDPMGIRDLDPTKWPVAAITGTEKFSLSPEESAAMKKYLAGGGTLIADAAGGAEPFAESVEREILPLVGNSLKGPLVPGHPIFRRPEPVEKVRYRRALAMTLGEDKNNPRLQGVEKNRRLVIVYSPDDLTGGLVGYSRYGLRGYAPDVAVKLMTNIVCHAAGVKFPPPPDRPAR
ncbi:MAG TPA: DUF4159 domain-containing protein, partial [Phycisphaerae bacterium]|nr:DUF4159 domain-containing protein [Phycisphaerae bacterium]